MWSGLESGHQTNQWWLLDILTWMGGKGKGNDRTTCQTVDVTKTFKWMQFICNKHTKLMAPEYVRQGNGHWKQVSIQNTRFAIPEEGFGWFVIPYESMGWHEKSKVNIVMWITDRMRNRGWRGNRALWGRSTTHLLLLIGNIIINASTTGAQVVITV